MFEGDYSKKVWIIGIIMAIGCIAMDIGIMLGDDTTMQSMVWITLPFSVFVLFKCIVGLKNKIKEEKENQ